jgi:hypothetical protein
MNFFILMIFALVLFIFARYTRYDGIVLQILGISTILHIFRDFQIGPSSDLEEFARVFILIPSNLWAWIWLSTAILITGVNIWFLFLMMKKYP